MKPQSDTPLIETAEKLGNGLIRSHKLCEQLRQEAAQLRADRDALAEALRQAIGYLKECDCGTFIQVPQLQQILAKHGDGNE